MLRGDICAVKISSGNRCDRDPQKNFQRILRLCDPESADEIQQMFTFPAGDTVYFWRNSVDLWGRPLFRLLGHFSKSLLGVFGLFGVSGLCKSSAISLSLTADSVERLATETRADM